MEHLFNIYAEAKDCFMKAGFIREAEWQLSLAADSFTESDLLREAAWVVLCSGFRENIVRNIFDYISLCFCDWESASEIVRHQDLCRETALLRLNHARKIDAILSICRTVHELGFGEVNERIQRAPYEELMSFPFIGPVTAFHLAKNLGFPVAKPDRHLSRLASWIGINDVQKMCSLISNETGDPVPYVDLILWRVASFRPEFWKDAAETKWQDPLLPGIIPSLLHTPALS